MNYVPIALPFFSVLAGILLVLMLLIQIEALRFAYEQLGVSPFAAVLLLFASLLGSYVNIPVWQLSDQHVVTGQEFTIYGLPYVMPVEVDWPGTIVAVNIGGAVIPTLLSLYLLSVNRLWVRGAIATAVVAALCHALATPVPGAGIALPAFIPPLVTTIAALIVAPARPAAVAYAAGSLGTLIGADLTNLSKVQGLGAPIVSIGGAGTFDGIFITGILAVLLASLAWRRTA